MQCCHTPKGVFFQAKYKHTLKTLRSLPRYIGVNSEVENTYTVLTLASLVLVLKKKKRIYSNPWNLPTFSTICSCEALPVLRCNSMIYVTSTWGVKHLSRILLCLTYFEVYDPLPRFNDNLSMSYLFWGVWPPPPLDWWPRWSRGPAVAAWWPRSDRWRPLSSIWRQSHRFPLAGRQSEPLRVKVHTFLDWQISYCKYKTELCENFCFSSLYTGSADWLVYF